MTRWKAQGGRFAIAPSLAVMLFAAMALPAHAATPLDARVARLEQQLESQALVDMALRLDRLEQEVQTLRGQMEEQAHAIAELRQRQRDLYLDVDRRLLRLERDGGQAPQAAVTPPPVAPPPSAALPGRPVAVAPAAVNTANAEQERIAYQQAFDQLRELRYEQAITAFRAFLKEYPDGRYGHIAQYWIGEANYAQRNFQQAVADYRELIKRYPKSPKLVEAMLKIGYGQYELGDKAEARRILTELARSHPDTTEAGQANAFLQKMRGEGN